MTVQLVACPSTTAWPCAFWIEYQPRLFRIFEAPMDNGRRTLGASIAVKEAQIKRWVDHVCSKHQRTLQLMAVRTLEKGSPVREGRMGSDEAYSVFARIAEYAGCPIVPCTVINLRSAEVDLMMRARAWDLYKGGKAQLCRLGIHMGFHSPRPEQDLQLVTRDNEAAAIMKMNSLYGPIQEIIDDFEEKPGDKPLDDAMIDRLFHVVIALSLDTDISKLVPFKDRSRLVKMVLEIADKASQHVQRRKERTLAELKRLQNDLHKT